MLVKCWSHKFLCYNVHVYVTMHKALDRKNKSHIWRIRINLSRTYTRVRASCLHSLTSEERSAGLWRRERVVVIEAMHWRTSNSLYTRSTNIQLTNTIKVRATCIYMHSKYKTGWYCKLVHHVQCQVYKSSNFEDLYLTYTNVHVGSVGLPVNGRAKSSSSGSSQTLRTRSKTCGHLTTTAKARGLRQREGFERMKMHEEAG